MAISPEVDALAAHIAGLQAFVSKLDGTSPITVSIAGISIDVDPIAMPEVYNAGAYFLSTAFGRAIADGRQLLADATLATFASDAAPAPAPSLIPPSA